jgi:hypothetical protein
MFAVAIPQLWPTLIVKVLGIHWWLVGIGGSLALWALALSAVDIGREIPVVPWWSVGTVAVSASTVLLAARWIAAFALPAA